MYQEIANELDELIAKHRATNYLDADEFMNEQLALQEKCGQLTHIFSREFQTFFGWSSCRRCVICLAIEKKKEG